MAKRPPYANNLQPSTFNLQQPWPKGHATRTTFNNLQPTTFNLQPTTLNLQPK
ncbi:MAG: hypothetical protein F6K65_16715 [Moorea sp. SIO3C2]|nr:hypothetical protein [Moorena sp. SIO3C2]